MENASKALILAGSVLIAILLISLGLWVFKAPSEAIREVGKVSGTLADSTFNAQFTKYAGNNVRGGQVKTLMEYVNTYNGRNPSSKIEFDSAGINDVNNVYTTNSYNVTCSDAKVDGTGVDGRISSILIKVSTP